jgi:hypothetical protein
MGSTSVCLQLNNYIVESNYLSDNPLRNGTQPSSTSGSLSGSTINQDIHIYRYQSTLLIYLTGTSLRFSDISSVEARQPKIGVALISA